jgi:phosphate transport system protein
MIDHTVRAFDADLRELSDKIEQMAELDQRQIKDAAASLQKRDLNLAQRVIGRDDEIDSLQHDVEERTVAIIARRQPMAVDLREIIGSLRISNDLERIGDLAENVAKRVILLTKEEFRLDAVMPQLELMVRLVLEQLKHVIESYQRHNVAQALEVWRRDQEIDALNDSLFRELLTYMMEDPHSITLCTHLLFCAKNFERMGDHTTNIAETVYYIVEGRAPPGERPKADTTSKPSLVSKSS